MEPDDQKQTEDLLDLEKAFQEETLSVPKAEPTVVTPEPIKQMGGFANTVQTLTDTDTKIEAKITELKATAKKELEDLKGLKNTIAKKIADIKELEETREKIKKELEKLQNLESEVGAITEEAQHELGSM